MEIDNIYNMDCLEGMKQIPDGTIDAVICDLPYGTMKGIDDKHDWDVIIPTMELFTEYERVLRMNGTAILFSQEPYTTHLRGFQYRNSNFEFCYPMIWKKDSAGNALMAKNAPISYFEDISVFAKRYDSSGHHPLRDYFAKVQAYIGKPKRDIIADIGQRADHTFRGDSTQFALCTPETYKALIDRYGIDKMDGFIGYQSLEESDIRFRRVFNLPDRANSMSNVLEFSKDTDGFHPTQKPVALIRRLVLTYTNEGDTVLDNCMGSGTTAIACIKERRHFIGFELSKEYFDKAVRRIKAEQAQLTLF
jgi:site-specific DNA-methyltransferase (adenine-specific)